MNRGIFLTILSITWVSSNFAQQRTFGSLPSGASAQDNILGIQPAFNQFFSNLKSKETKVDLTKTVGSPFEDENFSKGQLYDKDELIGDFYLRHNIYDDQIELKKSQLPEEPVQGLVKNSNFKAIYKNTVLSYRAFTDSNGNITTGYLQLLADGDQFKLYKRRKAIFTPATVPANPQTRPTPNRFAQFEFYFMSLYGVDQIIEVPNQTSKFIALFPKEVQAELQNYIKDNKLKVKKEEDLVTIFKHLSKSP